MAAEDVERIRINMTAQDSTYLNARRLADNRARRVVMAVDHRGRLPANLLADEGKEVTDEFINGPPGYEVEESNPVLQRPRSTTSIRVFISHSDSDIEVARLLIELLRNALHLRSNDIRCTSVDGYRMQSGASIDEKLRAEVHDAELLIGLITPDSLRSAYVIFELGARWGAEKPMVPLLASGAIPEDLEGPLAGINALDSRDEGQVHQLLEDAADFLHIVLDRTSSYTSTVNQLVQVSSESTPVEESHSEISRHPNLSEEAKTLLIEAVKSRSGTILRVESMGGLSVSVNGKDFVESGNRRSEARWDQAIRDLLGQGLVMDLRGSDQVYEVTHKGFQSADALIDND